MDKETQPLWATEREAMGKTWNVQLCPDDLNLTKRGGNLGHVRYTQQEISINANMPLETRDQILLHEILHAASYMVANELSEAVNDRVAAALFAFLRGFGLWRDFPWPDRQEPVVEGP